MPANAERHLGKISSPFRSLAELILPIAGEHDFRSSRSFSVLPHALAEPFKERIEMSMESVTSEAQELVGTVTGQLTPLTHAAHPTESPLQGVEEAMLADIETFRAYALETVERSLARLLTSVAQEVLGRELLLAPADISEIMNRALRRYDREGPIRIRVSSADLGTVQTELPVVVDHGLKKGDLVIEVRDGALDARLDVRLDCVVRRFGNEYSQSIS